MSRKKLLLTGVVALAILAAGVAAYVLLHHKPAPHTEVITHSVDNPSEAAVSASYSVPDNRPLEITIAKRGIQGKVQNVGVDQHGAIAAPNNVNLAGWFVDSVLPGQKGLSIIDGHVDGISQKGIFHDLSKVQQGDEVTIAFGGGTTYTYSVFKVQSVKSEDATKVLFEQDPTVKSQLNIITCTGTYDKTAKTYNQRVVVYAKLQ